MDRLGSNLQKEEAAYGKRRRPLRRWTFRRIQQRGKPRFFQPSFFQFSPWRFVNAPKPVKAFDAANAKKPQDAKASLFWETDFYSNDNGIPSVRIFRRRFQF